MIKPIRRERHFNLRNIDLKLLHSLAKKIWEKMRGDVHELTMFSGVGFCTCCQRDFDSALKRTLWTRVTSRFPVISISIPTQGSLLLVAVSIVKLIEGLALFNIVASCPRFPASPRLNT